MKFLNEVPSFVASTRTLSMMLCTFICTVNKPAHSVKWSDHERIKIHKAFTKIQNSVMETEFAFIGILHEI